MSEAGSVQVDSGRLLKLAALKPMCVGGPPMFGCTADVLSAAHTLKEQRKYVVGRFTAKDKSKYLHLLSKDLIEAYKFACSTIERLNLFPLQGYFMCDELDCETSLHDTLYISSMACPIYEDCDPEYIYDALIVAGAFFDIEEAKSIFADAAPERFSGLNFPPQKKDYGGEVSKVSKCLHKVVKDKKRAANLTFLIEYVHAATGCYFFDHSEEMMSQHCYGWDYATRFHDDFQAVNKRFENLTGFMKQAEGNKEELQKIIDDYGRTMDAFRKLPRTKRAKTAGGN